MILIAASDASYQSKGRANWVCPGTADQVGIQAYLTSMTMGGEIVFSEGHFSFTGIPVVPTKARVRGEGPGTVFTQPPGANLSCFFYTSADDVYFWDFCIDANGAAQTGGQFLLRFDGSKYGRVRGVTLVNQWGDAPSASIAITGTAEDIKVETCRLEAVGPVSTVTGATPIAKYITVSHCFSKNDKSGFVGGSAYVYKIEKNIIENAATGHPAIDIAATRHADIDGNTLRNGCALIYGEGAVGKLRIRNNDIIKEDGIGVSGIQFLIPLDGPDDLSLRGNNLYGSGTIDQASILIGRDGPWQRVSATDNSIYDAPGKAIQIIGGDYHMASHNRIHNPGNTDFLSVDGSHSDFSDNQCD